MTFQGIIAVIDAIDRHYPVFIKKKTAEDVRALCSEWGAFFKDYSDQEIADALGQYIPTNKFPPTVAELLEIAKRKRSMSDTPRLETARPLEVLTMERLEEEMKWVAVCEFQPISTDKKQVYDKFVELYGFKYDFGPILARVGDPWEGVEL